MSFKVEQILSKNIQEFLNFNSVGTIQIKDK